MIDFQWVGSDKTFVDEIDIRSLNDHVVVGRFGGNSSAGQYKNEDGLLIWAAPDKAWEFVILLDSHNTAQSAELVINTFENEKEDILKLLHLETDKVFDLINKHLLHIFTSEKFKESCKHITGETACLLVVRKENYLWWFSIGDCVLSLYHPELAALGEYQQNHRSFYEWIGQESTFNKKVPCYSSGTKELRKGENHIFMTTDGLIECPNTSYYHQKVLFDEFLGLSNKEGVKKLLERIKNNHVRDSTTIISWKIVNNVKATMPSDQKEG
ncbi:protein phosphatase 2C domain-containing protein [Bacillus salitolerans]|uniref:Protein phosphatase 2C domain-containing protein n=1 Tax=Bacillus salitolerans TaxID=1437434 RepID=A0ABW4LX00_9BACI